MLGNSRRMAARGSGTVREAYPRAADVLLLPAALAALPPRPIYGRAPDAKLPGPLKGQPGLPRR